MKIQYRLEQEIFYFVFLGGIKYFLHKHGFYYKQLIKLNSKSSVTAQEEFVNQFENMCKTLEITDSIVFLDAVHPQHNSSNAKSWIETGKEKYIEMHTGHVRLNLGAMIHSRTKLLPKKVKRLILVQKSLRSSLV